MYLHSTRTRTRDYIHRHGIKRAMNVGLVGNVHHGTDSEHVL